MREILALLRIVSKARQEQLTPADEKAALQKIHWQHQTLEKAREAGGVFQSSVQLLSNYLTCGTSDSTARMYASQMIKEYQKYLRKIESKGWWEGIPDVERWKGFETVEQWLSTINYVIQRAPLYNGAQFPMSSLFVFLMYTPSGASLFRLNEFNVLLRGVLQAWCVYLDTPASREVLSEPHGWLSADAQQKLCLHQSTNYEHRAEKYWEFKSFNDFFHREFQLDKYRPLSGQDDDKIIVSANDGTVHRIAHKIKLCDKFWAKGQNYSLTELLQGSPFIESFIRGDILQSFLAGSDYHRWHAPISGIVREARIIPGLTFSELRSEGLDISAGTESQGYEAMVNTRGLIVIEGSNRRKKVAVVPIGITEISSVTIKVKVGTHVQKGEELGYFSYGGSSLALIFQRNMIESFTAKKVKNPPEYDCKTVENCTAEQGCLRVRAEVAIAK